MYLKNGVEKHNSKTNLECIRKFYRTSYTAGFPKSKEILICISRVQIPEGTLLSLSITATYS
jgi:hypothetical protein